MYFDRPQRSCGKVISSQACAKNSVHRGRCLPQCMLGYTPPGRHPRPRGRHPIFRHPPGRHSPPPTATAADGTHPTGMLSCLRDVLTHHGTSLCSRDLRTRNDMGWALAWAPCNVGPTNKNVLRFVYIKRKRTQFFLAKLTHSGFAHGMGMAFHDKMSLKYVFNEEYHSNWCS